MAYGHVQTKQPAVTDATRTAAGAPATSLSETFASTPAVGNLVVVQVTHFNGTADRFSSVTDNQGGANTWTIFRTARQAGGSAASVAYCRLTAASGTFTVTAHFSAASDAVIAITEYSGCPAGLIEDGSAIGNGSSTTPSAGNLTPSQASDLFVSVIADFDSDQAWIVPSGMTLRAQNPSGSTGFVLGAASKISTDALAQSSTWGPHNSTDWACVIVAFKSIVDVGGSSSPSPVDVNLPGYFSPLLVSSAWPDDWLATAQRGEFDKTLIAWDVSGTLFTISLTATLGASGALSSQTRRSLSATLATAGALVKQTATSKTGAVSTAGALLKRGQKVLAGTLSTSGTLAAAKVAFVALVATLSTSGALVKQTSRSLAGTLATAGALLRQAAKVFSGSLASSGALLKQGRKLASGTLSPSGALLPVKTALKALTATLSTSGPS
jgi:hypothetical protein